LLTERKKKIKMLYNGYVFQLYAQYFCLTEMGYPVQKIKLYSMDDNKSYFVPLPQDAPDKLRDFEVLIQQMRDFELNAPFVANVNKCRQCVYRALCDYSLAD
jgi:CRISPR-associated protein Cas4